MNLTLRQLAIFEAVARLNSVSVAADELLLTQSAASMALQQLEQALGVELFFRAGKRLTLNQYGKVVQPMAKSVLLGAREIASAVNAQIPEEPLRIGASPTVANYLLTGICSEFLLRNPGARMSVNVLPAFEVINRVDEMAVDIGLIEFVSVRPTLDIVRWRMDALVVFCSPIHPYAYALPMAASELEAQPWCLQHRFADSRRQFALAILTRLATIDVVFESDSIPMLKSAVAANVGIGCLPRPCIEKELKEGVLCEIRIQDLELDLPFSIVSRKGVRRSSAHEKFLASLLGNA